MVTKDFWVLLAMVIYFVAMLTIGFIYSKRSNSSTRQYFAGGRGVGPWLTALSAEASDMSGWLLMGLPGVAYFTGAADPLWTALGLALGPYLNWKLVARRLRRYSVVAGDAITIPDFFSKRFHDKRNIVSLNYAQREKENEEDDAIRLARVNDRLKREGKPLLKKLEDLPKDYQEPDPYLDETVHIALDLAHEEKDRPAVEPPASK